MRSGVCLEGRFRYTTNTVSSRTPSFGVRDLSRGSLGMIPRLQVGDESRWRTGVHGVQGSLAIEPAYPR